MKEEILQILSIVQIVLIAVISFVFLDAAEMQRKELEAINNELHQIKKEVAEAQKELKHNDNIVDKIINFEW